MIQGLRCVMLDFLHMKEECALVVGWIDAESPRV